MTPSADITILVIDDEIQMQRLVHLALQGDQYRVLEARTAREGLDHATMDNPDLIVLDLGLPEMDGLQVLQAIRQRSKTPVIILSVRNSEDDIIACLDAGADDYLTKPFRTGELQARVRACLRKSKPADENHPLVFGTLVIDLAARTVTRAGSPVKLTATEYALLALFARNAGKVLTHRYLLETVWGTAYAEESQYTRVHVGHLRKKIEDDPANPTLIQTESGIGYRFG